MSHTRYPPPPRAPLTVDELRILAHIAGGHSNPAIAALAYMSHDGVKSVISRIFRKLGARDRAHAVTLAFRAGYLWHGHDGQLTAGYGRVRLAA